MAKDPAFLLYYKDILVSCADWDGEVLGWYTRLLCHQADKPGGLTSDIEQLAMLAGVKMSQFERFKSCWKHTLEAKFKATDSGLLKNMVQDENLEKRRKYKEKQMKRGLVGAYVKKGKMCHVFTAGALTEFTYQLFEVLNIQNSKEDNDNAFKRTLEAFKGNANAIGNTNGIKEKGSGKTIDLPQYGFFTDSLDPKIELSEMDIGKTVEFLRLKHRKVLSHAEVRDQWEAFKIQQIAVHDWKNSFGDLVTHFRNSLNAQIQKNGTSTNRQSSSGNSSKSGGKSAGAHQLLDDLREEVAGPGSG